MDSRSFRFFSRFSFYEQFKIFWTQKWREKFFRGSYKNNWPKTIDEDPRYMRNKKREDMILAHLL